MKKFKSWRDAGTDVQNGASAVPWGGGGLFLAALDQLDQRVAQLRQLEDLAVQHLQQGAQVLPVGLPLQLDALQALLQVAQLRLQSPVPRLGVLVQTARRQR